MILQPFIPGGFFVQGLNNWIDRKYLYWYEHYHHLMGPWMGNDGNHGIDGGFMIDFKGQIQEPAR